MTALGNDRLKDVSEAVDKAVKEYDPEAENEDENLEFKEKETLDAGVLFSRWSDGGDKLLLANGFFWSFLFGAAMPGFCIIFGELIDDMGEMAPGSDEPNPMKENTIFMVYVALGTFVTSALHISSFAVFSESIAYKLKVEYFEAALSKDAAFYDE